MKNLLSLLALIILVGFSACNVDEVLNPNSPTVESVENGATLADIRLLASGLQAVQRVDMNFHYWTVSGVGREYFDMRGTDPRYTSELLGSNGSSLDNNGFLTTRAFGGVYRTIRNANLLKQAVANTTATLSDSDRNAFLGFANTMIANELLREAVRQFENGMRIDVEDPFNLGPFTNSFAETLTEVSAILDDGFSELSATTAGDVLWALEGFGSAGATATEALTNWNRGLAARVALYQGDMSGARSAAQAALSSIGGDLNSGVYVEYGGATGNDLQNPFFFVPGVDFYMAHESYVTDAEDGDGRLSKVTEQDEPIMIDNLSSRYLVTIVPSNSSPFPILRNEELTLILAEANIGTDNNAAVDAINTVRAAAGLPAYDGGMDDASITEQLIYERRYSLFGEGHRWVDMRRWGRLGDLPLDRSGDSVHEQFPRPVTEGE